MLFLNIFSNVSVIVLEESVIMYYFMVYILGFEMELVVSFLIVERLLEVGGEYYEVELFDGGLVDEVLFYFSEILFYFGMIEFMVVEVMLFIDF